MSPILKNVITLYIQNFPYTLSYDDLSVQFVSQSNSTIYKYVNIIDIGNDNGNQNLSVKFGGADRGIYNVFLTSKEYGSFDTTGITIETVGKVTSFSPTSGSMYGGTLVTVTGYQFSNDPLDNPVQIGYTDCLV